MDFNVTYVLWAGAFVALVVAAAFTLAPAYAYYRGVKRVRILGWLGGWLGEYVEWDPNEVVIFRRGEPTKGEKGSTFIYPLFYEGVRGRVSLAVQSLTWKGTVSMKEFIPCEVELVVWWAVNAGKVNAYFFGHGEADLHESEEEAARAVAVRRLRELIGSRVSKAVSKAEFQSSLVLMFLLENHEYRDAPGGREAAPPRAADVYAGLERALLAELAPLGGEVEKHGLCVERVEVKSVGWADEVRELVFGSVAENLGPLRARPRAEADRILEDGRTASRVHRLLEEQKALDRTVVQFIEILKHARLTDGSGPSHEELVKFAIAQFRRLISDPARPAPPDAPAEPPKPELEDGKPDAA